MALEKVIPYKGIAVRYWKVTGVNITYTGRLAQIFIAGFTSKEAKEENFQDNMVELKNFMCKSDKFPEYFGIEDDEEGNTTPIHGSNTLQVCYAFLKNEVDDFKDSEDC